MLLTLCSCSLESQSQVSPKPVSYFLRFLRQNNPSLTESIAADEVTKLLKDSGASIDKVELNALVAALKGKKLHDLVRQGSTKLASIPSGGKEFMS